jgi:hypothetical protein
VRTPPGPAFAAGGNRLWVVSERRGVVTRVSPRPLEEVEQLRLGSQPGDLEFAFVALSGGSVWVAQFEPPAITRWKVESYLLQRRYVCHAHVLAPDQLIARPLAC